MTEQPTGELSLRIERRRDANGGDGSSVATSQFHRGALRVLRPYYADDSGQATYTVINPGGAYFGGDTYQLTLDVADNAALRVTTQSATKVYKTPQGPAHQTMHITLGESARLDYVPDQLIVYENGSYRQDTTVDMQPSSSLTFFTSKEDQGGRLPPPHSSTMWGPAPAGHILLKGQAPSFPEKSTS